MVAWVYGQAFILIRFFLCFALLISTVSFADSIGVVDDAGRVVALSKPAQRIVALSPHIVENLFSAGLGDKIVAAVEYSDYPKLALKIPRLGNHGNISIEAIASLKPDLVIVWRSGHQNNEFLLQQLEHLGIATYVDEPEGLSSISKSIGNLSRLGGTSEKARQVMDQFEARLNAFKTQALQRTQSGKIKLFYMIWNNPLMTLGGKHNVNEVIDLCGATNVFSDSDVLVPQIGLETVLSLDPDVIVASVDSKNEIDWFNKFMKWDTMTAVRESNLFYIESDLLSRHTVRMLDGVEAMCDIVDSVKRKRDARLHNTEEMNAQ
jgi:iron complex transport system substrate-binding protein